MIWFSPKNMTQEYFSLRSNTISDGEVNRYHVRLFTVLGWQGGQSDLDSTTFIIVRHQDYSIISCTLSRSGNGSRWD